MSPLALSLRLLQAQPDERLLALARAGHEPAFEALVRRYRRELLAYCRRVASPQASAEDILQQALLQAWHALARGTDVRDARAWLYRIVHNSAISAARRLGEDSAQLGNTVSAVEVEHVVEQRLAAREALAGVAALPELQREVMLGTAVQGRSHEEMAASLGLTSGSVRGLLYRARSTLRAAAAAVIPTPLIEWAARQQTGTGGGSAGVVDALAGGGSAGVAGAVLKGGAIVTVAGALAGTAAVVATHRIHLRAAPRSAAAAPGNPSRTRIVALANSPVGSGSNAPEPGAAATGAPSQVGATDYHGGRSLPGTQLGGSSVAVWRSHSGHPGSGGGLGSPSTDRRRTDTSANRGDHVQQGYVGQSGTTGASISSSSEDDGMSYAQPNGGGTTGPQGTGTTGQQGPQPATSTQSSSNSGSSGSD